MPDEPLVVLVDQNVPRSASRWLAGERPGWSLHHVFDLGLSRAPDTEIAAWAITHGAIVLTFDEDFADNRPGFPLGLRGAIRLRVWPTTDEEVIAALTRLPTEVDDARLRDSLVVVGRSSIHVRPWPPQVLVREVEPEHPVDD